MIDIQDTRDVFYFNLVQQPDFIDLAQRSVTLKDFKLDEKYKIVPLDFKPEEEAYFDFRFEISRIAFDESLNNGFYYVAIWASNAYNFTGNLSLVLIEKEKDSWRIKEIKYHR